MAVTKLLCRAVVGCDGETVRAEVEIAKGMPAFAIVGLRGAGVQQAKERVRSAIHKSSLPFPNRRVTVNAAPVDIRKEAPAYAAGEDRRHVVESLVAHANRMLQWGANPRTA